MDNPTRQIEELLAHSEWVRGLARRLVTDDASADDIVQEVWAAALAQETVPREPRAWLAGAVRNLVAMSRRSAGNRAVREERTARSEALTSVDEVASRAELERNLVDRVHRLPEAQRDVLLLRYFEGQTPGEIATNLDIPLATVRSRSARALDALRTQLDGEYGERHAWHMAFVPLALPRRAAVVSLSASSVPLLGGLAMKLLITAATAALFITSLVWWLGDTSPAVPVLFREAPLESALADWGGSTRPRPADQEALSTTASANRRASSSATHSRVRGVVVDLEGHGIEGVVVQRGSKVVRRVSIERRGMSPSLWTTTTDAKGAFEFAIDDDQPFRIDEPRHADYCAELGYTEWPAGGEARLVMRPLVSLTLDVQVTDSVSGSPASLFHLSAYSSWGEPDQDGRIVVGDPRRRSLSLLERDRETGEGLPSNTGHLRVDVRAAAGVPLHVSVSPLGAHPDASGRFDLDSMRREWIPVEGETAQLKFEVNLSGPEQQATSLVRGIVLDSASGEPLAGAVLSLGARGVDGNGPLDRRRVATDAGGRFQIACNSQWRRLDLEVSAAGYDLLQLQPERDDELTVELDPRGSLRALVVDSTNNPLAGLPYLLIGSPKGARRFQQRGHTDAQGTVSLDALRRGRYHLFLLPDPWAADEQALDSWSVDVRSSEQRNITCVLNPPDLVKVTGAVFGAQGLLPTFVGLEGSEGFANAEEVGPSGYQAGGLQRGAYFVLLFPADDSEPQASRAAMAGVVTIDEFNRQAIDFHVHSGVIEGQVRGAAGLRVTLVPRLGKHDQRLAPLFDSLKWSQLFGTQLDQHGAFRLEHLPDGPYRLEVRDGTRVRDSRDVDLNGALLLEPWELP